MFKRANKITALLVAAASVMSIVPAMAADATRLGTKEGTIKDAIAYDGGKYAFDGYRTDSDPTGIYYNAGDKDKAIEDLEDYKLIDASKYDSKYAYAVKGSDEYLVDLSSGKVVDDETAEEKMDSAKSKLRTTLKKASRYDNTNAWDDVSLTRVLDNQFGDVWYEYEALGNDTATTQGAVAANVKITLPTTLDIQAATQTTDAAAKYSITINKDIYKFNTDFTNNANLQTAVTTKLASTITGTLKDGTNVTFTASADGTNVKLTANVDGQLSDATISDLRKKFGTSAVSIGSGYQDATNFGGKYIGFVNNDGKYIDASYTANIYAFSSLRNKFVKVDEYYTNKDKKENTDDKVRVELNSLNVLAQDKDYIYAVANVTVTDTNTDPNAVKYQGTFDYLQKISKAQGDKPDGAWIPKTVDSYLFDHKAILDSGDANDANTAVFNDDDGYSVVDNQYRVKNNTLYVTRTKSDKVKIFKLKMTQIKEKLMGGTDKKYDAYVVKKDGDTDHDIFKRADKDGKKAVSIDVDGNTWALDKGAIYKYDGSDWKEMFTVDRSLDSLDVYNDGSLIAWENNGNDDGKVFTTVQEGTKKTQDESTAVAPVIKTNWDKNADGSWSFYDQTGAKVTSKWINVGGSWYYLKADGIMATGWYNDNGTWYYLQGSGAMSTGWLNDNGTWYYLAGSGAMLANTTVDGYKLGANGAWVK